MSAELAAFCQCVLADYLRRAHRMGSRSYAPFRPLERSQRFIEVAHLARDGPRHRVPALLSRCEFLGAQRLVSVFDLQKMRMTRGDRHSKIRDAVATTAEISNVPTESTKRITQRSMVCINSSRMAAHTESTKIANIASSARMIAIGAR